MAPDWGGLRRSCADVAPIRRKAVQQACSSSVASISSRSAPRFSVVLDAALDDGFPLKTKTQAGVQRMAAIGHIGGRCTHETDGWDVRVRSKGLPELVKSFAAKGTAREWADLREGETVKRQFVDYRAADRHTWADMLRHCDQNQLATLDKYHPERRHIRKISANRILLNAVFPGMAPALASIQEIQGTRFDAKTLKRVRARVLG
jgi:hypothetical protein